MNKENIYNTLGELLYRKPEIEFAYVFGSFVKSGLYYDIDIAVYLARDFNTRANNQFPYGYESSLISEIMLLLKTEQIDLLVLNKAGLLLQKRIINSGHLLFEREKYNRIKYENYVRKLYIDTEPIRKIKLYYLSKQAV
jgi:predicted nucleotidyltransferase